jgi:hypothetical protein
LTKNRGDSLVWAQFRQAQRARMVVMKCAVAGIGALSFPNSEAQCLH